MTLPADPPSDTDSDLTVAPVRRVSDVEYLTRDEALAILGIKKASLYTYVSRGLIRAVPEPGKRTSLYRRSDVERLQTRASQNAAVQRVAPVFRYGEPVVQTWITELTEEGPRYRGQAVTTLLNEERSFEYVAELVWGGLPPRREATWVVSLPEVDIQREVQHALALETDGAWTHPLPLMARLAQLLSERAATDISLHQDARACGMRLISAWVGIASCLRAQTTFAPLQGQEFVVDALLRRLNLDARQSAELRTWLNAALVLSIDHELTTPTFAARIAASTDVNLYACVVSALMAQSGSMQAGGMPYLENYLEEWLAAGAVMPKSVGEIPCFEHPLYDRDPRAVWLMSRLKESGLVSAAGNRLLELVVHIENSAGQYPNIFGALVIGLRALGLPRGCALYLHTLARCVGWLAHAAEQRLAGAMLRPRARYVGS